MRCSSSTVYITVLMVILCTPSSFFIGTPLCCSAAAVFTSSRFITSAIHPWTIWDGGLTLFVNTTYSPCCYVSNPPDQFGNAVPDTYICSSFSGNCVSIVTSAISASPSSSPWAQYLSTLLPSSAVCTTLSLNSLPSAGVTLKPAPGFFVTTPITLTFNSPVLGSCSGSAGGTLTISANSGNGGFVSQAVLNVTNEFDIQRGGLQFDLQLQYNNFKGSIAPQVSCPIDSRLNTGWTWTVINVTTARGTHLSIPDFDIVGFGNSTTITISFSSSDFVSSTLPLPSPSSVSTVIVSVDQEPLAFCVPLVPNITDTLVRNGAGVIPMVLRPSNGDSFVTYSNDSVASAAWLASLPMPLVLPDGVSMTISVPNTSMALMQFTSGSSFSLDAPFPIVWSPGPVVLRSRTAGCGSVRISIVPGHGLVTSTSAGTTFTEVEIQTQPVNLRFDIQFAKFLSGTLPVGFISTYVPTSSPTIETPFAAAVAAAFSADGSSLTIQSSSSTPTTATMRIPPLPSYNINFNRTECITIVFPGSVIVSGVSATMMAPSFCLQGVPSDINVTFASSGSNGTDVKTLWDSGDVLNVTLAAGVWNTTAAVATGSRPFRVYSPSVATLGFNPVNYSGVSFSTDNRTMMIPWIAGKGYAVLGAFEVGWLVDASTWSDCPLYPTSQMWSIPSINFTISAASVSAVTFLCSGKCKMTGTSPTATETDVRTGALFLVLQSVYDILVPQTALQQAAWSIFTKNASSIVSMTPFPTLSVTRVNNYTANFTFSPMPSYDITTAPTDALLGVVYMNAAFVRNGQMLGSANSSTRGFMSIEPNQPEPLCTLTTAGRFSVTESSIQQLSRFTLWLISSLNFTNSSICRLMANPASSMALTYTVSSGWPLNITVGNCSMSNLTAIPLTVYGNSSYEISSTDLVTFTSFRREMFQVGERCRTDPILTIAVLPASAVFTFYTFDRGSLSGAAIPALNATATNRSQLSNDTAMLRSVPFDATLGAAPIGERALRYLGALILVRFSGQLLSTCHFNMSFTSTSSALSTWIPSVNMRSLDGLCVVNRSSSALFFGVIPPLMQKTNAQISLGGENETFFLDASIGSSQQLPTATNSSLYIVQEQEDVVAWVVVGRSSKGSMRPLPVAGWESDIPLWQPNADFASWYNASNRARTTAESVAFINATLSSEDLSLGGFRYDWIVFGEQWLPTAPSTLADLMGVYQWAPFAVNGTLTAAKSVSSVVLKKLFPLATSMVPSDTISSDGSVFSQLTNLSMIAPATPSFYCTEDLFVYFPLNASTVTTSSVPPSPSYLALHVVSGPPTFVLSGTAVSGGTRQLLLGQLYLLIYLQNDNFVNSVAATSGIVICPTIFDTCSIAVSANLRVMNISLPATDLVLFTTTTFTFNLTSDNVVSGRNVSNAVSVDLHVESGVLTSVAIGGSVVDGSGATEISEAGWTSGVISALTFQLAGDSFLTTATEVLAGLRDGVTCTPFSDAYGFCSRLNNIIVGTIEVLDVLHQTIQVNVQADPLFDVYRTEYVTIGFTGIATSSTFAPIQLLNLTFAIVPTNGTLKMTSTLTSSPTAPLTPLFIQQGSSTASGGVLGRWTFFLSGERWNLGLGGAALRTNVLASLQSNVTVAQCATCFNARKFTLFSSQITLSNDARTITLYMNSDAAYGMPAGMTEKISIQLTNPDLFLSGLVPTAAFQSSTDWSMYIRSTAVTAVLASISPTVRTSLLYSSTTSGSSAVSNVGDVTDVIAVVAVPQDVLQTYGMNATVTLMTSVGSSSPYVWNYSALANSMSVFATSSESFTDSPMAVQPTGFAALRSSMLRALSPIPPAASGTSLVISLLPTAAYALSGSSPTETITIRLPVSLGLYTVSGSRLVTAASTPSTVIAPSLIRVVVSVTTLVVYALVSYPASTMSCAAAFAAGGSDAPTRFASNLSTQLYGSGSVVTVVSAVPSSVASDRYCNLTISLLGSSSVSASTLKNRYLASSSLALMTCCSIALAFSTDAWPSDDAVRAAVGAASASAQATSDTALQITWAFVGLGAVALVLLAVYWYMHRVRNATLSGAARGDSQPHQMLWDDAPYPIIGEELKGSPAGSAVAAGTGGSPVSVWQMQLQVEDSMDAAEAARLRREWDVEQRRRIHVTEGGQPSFAGPARSTLNDSPSQAKRLGSGTSPSWGNNDGRRRTGDSGYDSSGSSIDDDTNAIHDSVYAGQPSSVYAGNLARYAQGRSVPLRPVDVPPLPAQDDLVVAPSVSEVGFVMTASLLDGDQNEFLTLSSPTASHPSDGDALQQMVQLRQQHRALHYKRLPRSRTRADDTRMGGGGAVAESTQSAWRAMAGGAANQSMTELL